VLAAWLPPAANASQTRVRITRYLCHVRIDSNAIVD
jgi:hypothetical protein